MVDLILDLRHVSPRERLRSWHRTIRRNYLDLDIRFDGNATPAGVITQRRVGPFTFGVASSIGQTHERTAEGMDDDVDHLFLLMQLRGRTRMIQRDREIKVTPGRFIVSDARETFCAQFCDDHRVICLKIPRPFFRRALDARREFVNVSVGEERGSTIVVDYFRRAAREFDNLTPDQQFRVISFGLQLTMDVVDPAGAPAHV